MRTIVCFGGSFNPPHNAHLKIALAAKRFTRAHELWFIPTLESPLKDSYLAPFEQRAQMVEAMIKAYRKLKVCRIESTLPTPSYTIQTVEALQERYPNTRFIWLIGSDQAMQFEHWKEAVKLKSLIQFVVYRRADSDVIPEDMIEIPQQTAYKISSTDIREGSLHYCPDSVRQYILDHELYLEDIAQSLVSPKRWKHVKAMTELALDLASAHNLDYHAVLIAALFHDCAKEWTFETSQTWLKVVNPKYLQSHPALWHQKLGAYWLSTQFKWVNPKILKAMAHHVEGLDHDPITQVIYIADKCDKTRAYDASFFIQLAYQDLKKGYEAVLQHQLEYRKQEERSA